MGYQHWKYETLHAFCMEAFEKFGFTEAEANIIQDVLLTSDLYGIESHGMQRMVRYHKCIEKGMIHVDTKPEVVFETPVSAVIDGHDGMGQLIGHKAMTLAIEKAKQSGVGIVSVRNSNHYGIAGYYAKMACREGLIGFSCTNSEAIMVPTNGRLAMLGSNPIACAMPAEPYDFFFDASTTVVTRGKLEMYNKAEKPLPEGWALDKDGHPSTNAPDVLANIVAKNGGGIMPLGGSTEQLGSHKGYGYGMLCEIFSSILSMGATSNYCMTGGRGNICHGFAAINPAFFGDAEAIKKHLSTYLEELRESPKAEGRERIYTHGEKEIAAISDRKANGIPVNDNTMVEVLDLCSYLHIDFSKAGVYDYTAALCVFMPRSELNDIFDLGEDYYSGYFSDTELTDIKSQYIGSVVDLDALTKISRQLDVSMGSMMGMVNGFAIVIYMVLLYLLSKIIIEKNAQSISMVKILGYTNGEISRLYILSTSMVVVLCLLLSLPLETVIMKVLFREMMLSSISGWITLWIDPMIYLQMFAAGIVTYTVVALLEFRRIKKVPMDEALKNVE